VLVHCDGTDNDGDFTYPSDKGLCADDGDPDDLESVTAIADLYCTNQYLGTGVAADCDVSCAFTDDPCVSHDNIVYNVCESYTEGSGGGDDPVGSEPCEVTIGLDEDCLSTIDFITVLITDAKGATNTGYVAPDHREDVVGEVAPGSFSLESEWVFQDGEITYNDYELECDGEQDLSLNFTCE